MGLLNKLWSGADFWDKKENKQQRDQFAQQEAERKKREAEARAQALIQQQQPPQQQASTPTASFFGIPRKPTPLGALAQPEVIRQLYRDIETAQPPRQNKMAELDRLKNENMARALEEEKKRTSWFDRQFTDRKWDKRAEATAINRAAAQYQDKYGWNRDQDVLNYQQGARTKLDESQKNAVSQWVAPVISTARVGTGIAQGASGLYDLVTPGKGTNRFSQAVDRKAQEQDQLAKDMGIDKAYKAGNVIGEIASYLIPGAIAAKGAKALTGGGKLAVAAGKYSKYVDDIAKMIDKGGDANKIRQFIAARVRQNFTVEEAIQELMITGRYMGQNTARGGDTSAQSVATDFATSFAGSLLVPARGLNKLFDTPNPGQAADDVSATAIAGGTEYLDNVLTQGRKSADVPPVRPDVPRTPGTEVSPGVISVNQAPEPTVAPQTVPTTPTVQQPVATPPVQQQLDLPEAPRVNETPVYQQIEAPQKPVPMEQAPTPVQVVPEAAPVTTPIKEASQEVVQNTAPVSVPEVKKAVTPAPTPKVDDATLELRGRREALAAERDARAAEGLPTADLDRRIAQLDKAIANRVNKTPEAKTLAEGEKQLEEALTPAKQNKKPEISKQEAPSKPKAPEKGVTTRQMSPEEMKASGMSDEAIANIMAKRATEESGATPVKPEPKVVAEVADTTIGNPDKVVLNKGQNSVERVANTLKEAGYGKNAINEIMSGVDINNNTLMADDLFNSLDEFHKTNVRAKDLTGWTKAKAAASEATPAVETPSKPKRTRAELQKSAAENVTRSGKVTAAWKKQAMKEAGTDPEQLEAVRSAIAKVEGPAKPRKVPKEMAGGIASAGTQGVSVSGDIIEKTSKEAAEKLGRAESNKTTAVKFLNDMAAKEKAGEAFSQKDAETALDLQKKVEYLSKEWHDLGDVDRKSGTQAAQTLATRRKQIRDTGTAEDIVANYINRLRDNTGVRLTSEDISEINKKVAAEVKARTEFNKAQEDYLADTASPEKQKAAMEAARARNIARKEAMLEEMRTTVGIKGGDSKAKKDLAELIDKLNKDADVWQMDYIDTGLLSSTGTWVANIVNSIGGGIEETLFGRLGAKIARGLTKTNIGGGNAFGIKAQKSAFQKLFEEAKTRTGLPSKNKVGKSLNFVKNFVTTMNEIGNTQIEAAATASVGAEYRNLLKAEYPTKFGGKLTKEASEELDRLVEYRAFVDPLDLKQKYIDSGFKVQGMAAVLGRAGKTLAAKAENRMTDWISNGIRTGDSNPIPKPLADNIGKLITRVTFGFPTIVVRSAGQGLRRVTAGVPTFFQATLTKDPVEKAMLIKQGVKEFGSGVAMVSAGIAAGQSGMITGAYPTDKTTQDEWAEEGKSEWSIKIGDSYYGLPRMLGPFAIPFLVGAQLGDNIASGDGIFQADAFRRMADSIAKSYDATMPAGQISDNLETLTNLKGLWSEDENERKKADAALTKFAGNALRIGTVPLSGMLNQITQSTTDTQKDTEGDGGIVEPIIRYVMSGIPWLNQKLPDKTSSDGTVLTTTNPLARFFGAQSSENKVGVTKNEQEVEANQNDLSPIINDKSVYDLLEPETQKLLDQTQDPKSKKKLNDQNFETIYKNVSKTTEKLAAEGKWGSYGNTLKIKLATEKADKTSTPEKQAIIQRQITQADILDKNGIDARIFALYDLSAEKGGISASDFKKMIDPEDEYYDIDTANALWRLDQLFTEAGVSGNNTGAIDPWTKQKYSMPKDKKGSGSGGTKDKGISTNFGTVGAYAKAPGAQAQKYQKIANTGTPLANLTTASSRTNLRKNISVAKGVRL